MVKKVTNALASSLGDQIPHHSTTLSQLGFFKSAAVRRYIGVAKAPLQERPEKEPDYY